MPSLHSPLLKQVIGGTVGMLVASVLYLAIQFGPNAQSVQALLVSSLPQTNTAQVRVNDKTIDDSTLRRLEQRASAVTDMANRESAVAAGDGTSGQQSQDVQRTESVARYASLTQAQPQETASEQAPSMNERILQRAEKRVADARERQSTVTEGNEAAHAGAPLTQTGIATSTLFALSFLFACGYAVHRRAKKESA